MNERSLDQLADLIAARVQARLSSYSAGHSIDHATVGGGGHDCRTSACHGCGHCVAKKQEVIQRFIENGAARFSAKQGIGPVDFKIARQIDHTLLKPDVTQKELAKVCDEAITYRFATVCVNPVNIPFVAKRLSGSGVLPIAVVGFPLGASTPSAKAFEAREAIKDGAREIDMVINIGALKSGDYECVYEDICRVVEASQPYPVKVILEVGLLADEEKIIGCVLAKLARATFVKTSTGFGQGGATLKDVRLMRRVVGPAMGVKASGGIRTRKDAEAMIAAGADRIGASASVAIVTQRKNGVKRHLGGY